MRCSRPGTKPHMIIGDIDSVSDAGPRCGAQLIIHAYRDGVAPGAGAHSAIKIGLARRFSAPGISEDIALLLAGEGCGADRGRRHPLQPDRVIGARPCGDVVDVGHASEGGGDPHRREGRVSARERGRRALAVGRPSPSPGSAPSWSRSSPRQASVASSGFSASRIRGAPRSRLTLETRPFFIHVPAPAALTSSPSRSYGGGARAGGARARVEVSNTSPRRRLFRIRDCSRLGEDADLAVSGRAGAPLGLGVWRRRRSSLIAGAWHRALAGCCTAGCARACSAAPT